MTAMDEDDGDYATLRELPLPQPVRRPENREDTVSEEGKVSLALVGREFASSLHCFSFWLACKTNV